MREYRYITADVFTATRFGGNQLAVLPDARGLSTEEMLAITREFNYSESTFVLPPDDPSHTRRVRIFTPGGEMRFAGHPTVGTAHVLAAIGEVALTGDETRVVFEELVGPVPVLVRGSAGKPTFAQLTAAMLPEATPAPLGREALADMLTLGVDDLLDGEWGPQAVSVGLPFIFVPLRSRDAVRRARLRLDRWEASLAGKEAHMLVPFAMEAEDPAHQVRLRMFGPGVGVPEDPATGSACAALGGYLGARVGGAGHATATHRWIVEQGYEMGRPSLLHVECDKTGDAITAIRVGGESVLVMEGTIRL